MFVEFKETIIMATDSLRSNKLRSFLASLGVMVGISFVVLMGWLLSALDSAMSDTFSMIGADMVYVDKWDWAGGKRWEDIRNRKNITLQQAEELTKRLTMAEVSFPSVGKFGVSIKFENDKFDGMSVQGTKFEHSLTPAGEIFLGRHFTQFEDLHGVNVAVIGYQVYKTIFPDGNSLEKIIKINGVKFKVIGVIPKRGTMFLEFVDNQIFIPLNSFMSLFGSVNKSVNIAVKAGSPENLENVKSEITGIMREIRNLKPEQADDFSLNETKVFDELLGTMRTIVWSAGIGLTIISFLVGIIGIMNIMFVSVTERTKEIGIRKAIGAKKRTIILQFLVESSTLCVIGAVISLVSCSILVFLTGYFLPQKFPATSFLPMYLPYQFPIIATAVSIFVGVMAGLIPAYKASNLDPVDALRYE